MQVFGARLCEFVWARGDVGVNPELGDRWLAVMGFSLAAQATSVRILSWRPYLWDAAIALFLEHPINGVGIRAFGVSSEALVGYGVADRIPGAAYNWSPHLSALEVAADLGTDRPIGVRATADDAGSLADQRADAERLPPVDCANGAISPWLNPVTILRAGFCGGMDINRCRIGICESGVPQSAAVIDPVRRDSIDTSTKRYPRENLSTVVLVELVAAYY